MAFIGIKIFAVRKSRLSKIVFPQILKLFKSPNDKLAKMDKIATDIETKTFALILVIFALSIKLATGTSKILIPDVSAAKNNRMKNAPEIISLYGIWEKIWGRVTKTSPAPEFGSSPKENIAGKIIIPADSANNVSKILLYKLI